MNPRYIYFTKWICCYWDLCEIGHGIKTATVFTSCNPVTWKCQTRIQRNELFIDSVDSCIIIIDFGIGAYVWQPTIKSDIILQGKSQWCVPGTLSAICIILCFVVVRNWVVSLQWRHNGHDGVSNHQPHHCLLNCLFRRRSKKTSRLRVTGLCAGYSPLTGELPAQRPVTRKIFPFDDVIMSHPPVHMH